MTFKYTFGHYANKRFVERIPQFHAEYRYGHCSHIRCSHAHVLVQTHIQTHTLSSALQSKHIYMHYTRALSHIHRRTHTASIILLYTTHPRAKYGVPPWLGAAGWLLSPCKYQVTMGFDVNFFTEHSLLVVFLYLLTYCINANSKNPHLPFSFKSYVFALRDGGHLWPDGNHLGFLGQNDVIPSNWCQNRNSRSRCTRKSVFIHASRCSGLKVTFSFYQLWRPSWISGS